MKIGIQNPLFIFGDPARNFNGYNLSFLKKHATAIYLTRPWQVFRYRKRLSELGIDPDAYRFIYREKTLNSAVDVLIGFDGEPYDAKRTPPKGFSGKKVWHVMDYVFKAAESSRLLSRNGVDLLMGYARHDLHCNFFKTTYSPFIGKLIPVPFGFGDRFKPLTPFGERQNACVAMGAVNPVNDPECPPGTIDDYIAFYRHKEWTHEFRREIASNASRLKGVDSFLPLFPETKNPHIDPVQKLNQYKLYVNDEGLLNFPPARTYEGIATGCVMIASRSPIYEELGFVEGLNYIAFEKNNLNDFQRKLDEHLARPELLDRMHAESLKLSKNFTHEAVADRLHAQIIAAV